MQEEDEIDGMGLSDLVDTLTEVKKLVDDAYLFPEQDRWLVIYELIQVLYALVVKSTSIELHNFHRLPKYFNVASMESTEWLDILSKFVTVFLLDCKVELEVFG